MKLGLKTKIGAFLLIGTVYFFYPCIDFGIGPKECVQTISFASRDGARKEFATSRFRNWYKNERVRLESCLPNEECIAVRGHCEDIAINKKFESEYEEYYRGVSNRCLAVVTPSFRSAKCVDNKCTGF